MVIFPLAPDMWWPLNDLWGLGTSEKFELYQQDLWLFGTLLGFGYLILERSAGLLVPNNKAGLFKKLSYLELNMPLLCMGAAVESLIHEQVHCLTCTKLFIFLQGSCWYGLCGVLQIGWLGDDTGICSVAATGGSFSWDKLTTLRNSD